MLCPKEEGSDVEIIASNEYSGLISFRMDCLNLLAVQGTLKSLLQHHSSKASILWARGSAGEYQADEQAGVARLRWRVSGR